MKIENAQNDRRNARLLRLDAASHMYKYCGSSRERREWVREALVESKLYFPPRSTFNDPLDCRIPLQFNASKLFVENYWRNQGRKVFPGRTRSAYKKFIERMVRRSLTPAGHKELSDLMLGTLDHHGILCFSTRPESMLMWSYYAASHTGVALRLNLKLSHLATINEQFVPLEVRYLKEFPKINYYRTETPDLIDVVFGSKAAAWSHECEWRLILVNRVGKLKVVPSIIDGVILGLNTPADYEASIRRWIGERNAPTELLRIQNRPGSFDLDVVSAE
jgi:hypothetical protein